MTGLEARPCLRLNTVRAAELCVCVCVSCGVSDVLVKSDEACASSHIFHVMRNYRAAAVCLVEGVKTELSYDCVK